MPQDRLSRLRTLGSRLGLDRDWYLIVLATLIGLIMGFAVVGFMWPISKAEALLEGMDGRVFVEVKSVTLCQDNGQGLFPDAVSERGRKHLRELAAIRDESTRAVMFFCVLHEGIESVSAAGKIDPRYRDTLLEVVEQGVEVLAWRASVSPEGIILDRPLPFSVDPHE